MFFVIKLFAEYGKFTLRCMAGYLLTIKTNKFGTSALIELFNTKLLCKQKISEFDDRTHHIQIKADLITSYYCYLRKILSTNIKQIF